MVKNLAWFSLDNSNISIGVKVYSFLNSLFEFIGNSWNPLKAPQVDSDNQYYDCTVCFFVLSCSWRLIFFFFFFGLAMLCPLMHPFVVVVFLTGTCLFIGF